MSSFDLSDRSRQLLATLVREYIETGEPVSSQVLARESGLGVSSATVRSVLTQLEDAGYVICEKSFAGRTPRTEYRLNAAGRRAFEKYLDHMDALIKAARRK